MPERSSACLFSFLCDGRVKLIFGISTGGALDEVALWKNWKKKAEISLKNVILAF